jgi:hypothetical protein
MVEPNLNNCVAEDAGATLWSNPNSYTVRMEDVNARPKTSGEVTCFFRDIEGHLCQIIQQYPVVVGCTAWLTNTRVLEALATKEAAFVVQKEDFLRPDAGGQTTPHLRRLYQGISGLTKRDFSGVLRLTSVGAGDDDIGVRCMGISRPRGQTKPTPVMHHKFLLFGRRLSCSCPEMAPVYSQSFREAHARWQGEVQKCESLVEEFFGMEEPEPDRKWAKNPSCAIHRGAERIHHNDETAIGWEAVWTGSFNPTQNATRSLENAVFIRDAEIAAAYGREFEQVVLMSEPLDWESPWVCPEWRIGT